MPKSQNRKAPQDTSATLLQQLIYRAAFNRHELTTTPRSDGGWTILLSPGIDPGTFRVRNLAHMAKAYGLKCEILGSPAPNDVEPNILG